MKLGSCHSSAAIPLNYGYNDQQRYLFEIAFAVRLLETKQTISKLREVKNTARNNTYIIHHLEAIPPERKIGLNCCSRGHRSAFKVRGLILGKSQK